MENRELKEQERLSKAIDAMHTGAFYPADAETEQLMAVARLVKQSGAVDQASARLIQSTVETLADELGKRKKRQRAWLFSGVAGAVAAACLMLALNTSLFIGEDPNQSYTNNGDDLSRIVQIQRQATEPSAPSPEKGPVEAARQTPAEMPPEGKPAETALPKAAHQASLPANKTTVPQTFTAASEQRQEPPAGEKLLALAGRSARSKTVDAATGEIRQSYTTDAGEVTLVQPGHTKTAKAAKETAPDTAATTLRKAQDGEKQAAQPVQEPKQGENQTTDRSRAVKLNKVTISVDGIEATLEGEQSEEELAQIAKTVVTQ